MAAWEDDGVMLGLLDVTAGWLDECRRQALRQGMKALDQYDLIQSRVRRVAGSCSTPEVATSEIHRLLMQVAGRPAAPSNSACSEAGRVHDSVTHAAEAWGVTRKVATGRWLGALQDRTGYLIALLRKAAQVRREAAEDIAEIERAGVEAEAILREGM